MADPVVGPIDHLMAFGEAPPGIAFWDQENATAMDKDGQPILTGEGETYSRNPWDLVKLDGKPLPGICKVTCEPELQIDQKKGPGHDGAALTIHGFLPGPVVITTILWTHEQWNAFNDMRPGLIRAPAKDDRAVKAIAEDLKISTADAQNYVAAVAVTHPWFESNSVEAVIIRGISIDDGPVPQSKVVRLKCQQFLPPTKHRAPAKPKNKKKVPIDSRVDAPKSPKETGGGPGDHRP